LLDTRGDRVDNLRPRQIARLDESAWPAACAIRCITGANGATHPRQHTVEHAHSLTPGALAARKRARKRTLGHHRFA